MQYFSEKRADHDCLTLKHYYDKRLSSLSTRVLKPRRPSHSYSGLNHVGRANPYLTILRLSSVASIGAKFKTNWQLPCTWNLPTSGMATPQALTAVIRASKPEIRSKADKAVFAIHAIISVNGFSLRKIGEGVDAAVAQGGGASLPDDEADLTGWNQEAQTDGGMYSFLYIPEPGVQRPPTAQQQQQHQLQEQAQSLPAPLLLLKCLRLSAAADGGRSPETAAGAGASAGGDGGGVLLVSLADVLSGLPPASFELQLDRYVSSSAAPGAGGYVHLEELISRVQEALEEALQGPEVSSRKAAGRTTAATTAATTTCGATSDTAGKPGGGGVDSAAAAAAAAQRGKEEEEEEERRRWGQQQQHDPLLDERYTPPGMPTRGPPPPGWGPMGVGEADLMPGGLPRPPGLGGGLGGVPLDPRGMGGGMHVGPENPIFADRLRHPRGGPGFPPGIGGGPGGVGGGAVPGMRWDPIAPEGLLGWSPDDYTRVGRAQRGEGFNDIGRPPPGRGPDWDHMFG